VPVMEDPVLIQAVGTAVMTALTHQHVVVADLHHHSYTQCIVEPQIDLTLPHSPPAYAFTVSFVANTDPKDEAKNIENARFNINERILYEDALRKAKEDAEKAHVTKTMFLENISQELRNPVNGIIGFVDLLFQTFLDESQREILRLINSSSKAILGLLNDIADATQLHAGILSLQSRAYDLHSVVYEVADVVNLVCISKDVELDVILNGDIPQYVIGDDVRLRQILTNLVTNAAKYTDIGYVKITVSSNKSCDPAGASFAVLNFCIEDTGCGISEEDLKQIFQRFSRLENSVAPKISGSGFGLSICKALSKLMGGSITASSRLGKGSLFSVDVLLELPTTYPKPIM
jgi:signal transduction histidine kinase